MTDDNHSSPLRVGDAAQKWYKVIDMAGNLILFRVVQEDSETLEITPIDAQDLVERVYKTLQSFRNIASSSAASSADSLHRMMMEISKAIYDDLSVQVIPLDVDGEEDGETEKNADKAMIRIDEEEALDDMWTILTVMLTFQHWDGVIEMLKFHRDFAGEVVQHLLTKHQLPEMIQYHPRYDVGGVTTPVTTASDATSAAMLLLSPVVEEMEPTEDELCQIRIDQVLQGLTPLIEYLRIQQESCTSTHHDAENDESKTFSQLVDTTILRDVKSSLLEGRKRTDGLLLGVASFFNACPSHSSTQLRELFENFFAGLLLPVTYTVSSMRCNASDPSSEGIEIKTDSDLHMWLPYAPQDAHKLHMLVVWLQVRLAFCPPVPSTAVIREMKKKGTGATSSATAQDYGLQRQQMTVPCIHCCELSLLLGLLSNRCDAEGWEHVLVSTSSVYAADHPKVGAGSKKGKHSLISASKLQPISVTMLLTAGVLVAEGFHACAYPLDCNATGHSPALCSLTSMVIQKTRVLLQTPWVRSQLEQFLLQSLATQTECFHELWSGLTAFHGHHKFQSRLELFYYGVCESVLTAMESIEEQSGVESTSHTISTDCVQWFNMWKRFLEELCSTNQARLNELLLPTVSTSSAKPSSTHRHRDPSGGMSVAEEEASANTMASLLQSTDEKTTAPDGERHLEGSTGEEEVEQGDDVVGAQAVQSVLNTIIESLPDRLQEGDKGLLRQLYTAIFGGEKKEGTEPFGLDEQFEKAQRSFGKRADQESDEIKLKFYGLFKQATIGDVNIPKPWVMDRVGRAKWQAWDSVKGLSQESAKQKYVDEFRLLQKH